jgi:uncharacterized membrane-anchored protein
MHTGLIILLLVGIILMTGNAAKVRAEKKGTTNEKGEKVVYKYLPLDLDAFYRQDAISKPSKIYYSMFTDEDMKR